MAESLIRRNQDESLQQKNRMKIGLVRRGYSPTGGAERFLIRFAEGLRAQGHQAVLFSDCGWPSSAWDDSRYEMVSLASAGRTLSPLAFADALEAVQPKQHCDFLFSFERVWSCDAYRAGDGVHRAWLQRRALFEPGYKSWFRGGQKKHRQMLELEAALYSPQSGVRIVANSQMVKKEIIEFFGKPEDHITVIANGYDAESPNEDQYLELRRKKRQQWEVPDDEMVLLFAGSGWERKGLVFALQAFAQFKQSSQAHFMVAGKGKAPRGVSEQGVHFLGEVDGLTPSYEAADVFILPTLYDPFSNACLEAAAYGLPVITTTANGFADVVQHLQQGAIVEPGDVDGMAMALEKFAADFPDPKRHEIRAWAAEYSVARNVQASLEFILSLDA